MATTSMLERMTENTGVSDRVDKLFGVKGGKTASFCSPFVIRQQSNEKKSVLSPMLRPAASTDQRLREPLVNDDHWRRLDRDGRMQAEEEEGTEAGSPWRSVERKRLGEAVVIARAEQKLKDELRERFDFWAFVSDCMKRYRHDRSPGGCMTKWNEIETLWFTMKKNKGVSGNGLFGVDLVFFKDFEPFMDKTKDRFTETYILDNDFDLSSVRQKGCAIGEAELTRDTALQSLLRAPLAADDGLIGDMLRGGSAAMRSPQLPHNTRTSGMNKQDPLQNPPRTTSANGEGFWGYKFGDASPARSARDAGMNEKPRESADYRWNQNCRQGLRRDTELERDAEEVQRAPSGNQLQSTDRNDGNGKSKVRVGTMVGCYLEKLHIFGEEKTPEKKRKKEPGALIAVVVASYSNESVNVRTLDNTIAELRWQDVEGMVGNLKDFVDKDCADHPLHIGSEVCLRPQQQEGASIDLKSLRKANEHIFVVRCCGQGWIFCTKKYSRRPRLLSCHQSQIMRRDRMTTTPEPWAPNTCYPFVLRRKSKDVIKGLVSRDQLEEDLSASDRRRQSGAPKTQGRTTETDSTSSGQPGSGGAGPPPSHANGEQQPSSSGAGGDGGPSRPSGQGNNPNDPPRAGEDPGAEGKTASERNFDSLYKHCAWVERDKQVFFCVDVSRENGLGAIVLGSDNKLRTKYDLMIEGGYAVEPHEQGALDRGGFQIRRGAYVTYKKDDLGDTAIVLSIAEDWLLIQNKILTNKNGATLIWSKRCMTLKNRGKTLLADLEGMKYRRRTDDKVPPRRTSSRGGNGPEDTTGTPEERPSGNTGASSSQWDPSDGASGSRKRGNDDRQEEGETKKQREKRESQHENRTQSLLLAMQHVNNDRTVDAAEGNANYERLLREQREDRDVVMAESRQQHTEFMAMMRQWIELEKQKKTDNSK